MRHYLHFLLAAAGGLVLTYLPGSILAMIVAMPGCWCPIESYWGAVRGAAVLNLVAATGFWLIGHYRPLRASLGRSMIWGLVPTGCAIGLIAAGPLGPANDASLGLAAVALVTVTLGYLPFVFLTPDD